MADRTVNSRIAVRRGWQPPMSVTSYHADWLSPDGVRHECPPRFDTDPVASMELLHELAVHNPEYVKITFVDGAFEVLCVGAAIGQGELLEAAIAAAYLAAREAKGG